MTTAQNFVADQIASMDEADRREVGPVRPTTAEMDEMFNRCGMKVSLPIDAPYWRDVFPYLAAVKEADGTYSEARRFPSWQAVEGWCSRTVEEWQDAGGVVVEGPLSWTFYAEVFDARRGQPTRTLYRYI